MDIPVTVTTHSIEVDVTNEVVSVVVAVQTKTIQVTINYGLNATQVDAAIDAKLSKENVVGLKLTDSPEFADTEITGLATESTYTPAVWSYLVGLFTTVPKSVLQHIVKIWTVMQNLAARIYVLENKTLFEITLSEDTTQVDITDLDIGEGIPLKVIISGKDYAGSAALLRINGINTANYQYNVSTLYSYFVILTYPSRYLNDFTFTLHSGNIIGISIYSRDNSGSLTGGIIHQSTFDLNISKIQSISIFRASTYVFTAGTKIRLIKV